MGEGACRESQNAPSAFFPVSYSRPLARGLLRAQANWPRGCLGVPRGPLGAACSRERRCENAGEWGAQYRCDHQTVVGLATRTPLTTYFHVTCSRQKPAGCTRRTRQADQVRMECTVDERGDGGKLRMGLDGSDGLGGVRMAGARCLGRPMSTMSLTGCSLLVGTLNLGFLSE